MRKTFGKIKDKSLKQLQRRKLSIRKKVVGTAERPRVCLVRTNKHISVQVIDDAASRTLLAVNTFGKKAVKGASDNAQGAKLVGAKVAEELKAHKINTAVFDRAGRRYTGVTSVLVDSIRENGIQI